MNNTDSGGDGAEGNRVQKKKAAKKSSKRYVKRCKEHLKLN